MRSEPWSRKMRHLEGVALCGPSLRNDEGDFEYSAARRQPTVTYQLLREGLGLNESSRVASELMRRLRSPYDLERVQSVEAVSGAAMLLRRSALEEVGVFDPSFRHCGEDVDLCARLLDAGYEIRFVPDALVWHRRGRSSRQARHRTEMEAALGLHRYFELRGSRADALAYRLVVSGVKAPRQALGALRSFWKSRDRAELQRDLALARSLVRFRPLRTCGP
ncbi:MAG: glycosyltransferase family 2 protein [Acidimicrobiia bacterium]|nr:glycosyltransferase family 2 protein [Acidimicrobiia bacterium]